MKSMQDFSKQIDGLKAAFDNAEAVVIGAGAGLSTSAGFTYSGKRFHDNFADFEEKYGFHDMYTGGFYPYASPEELWAYWSRNILINRYQDAPKPVYDELFDLVKDRDYFVITTNVDHCFQKAGFDKQRLFYTQGDYGLFQCSVPCHDKTYDNEELIRRMVAEQRDMKIPSGLVPRCPVCGKPMTTNLRCDDTFVQDEGWYAACGRYENFVERNKNKRVVYLELGVGGNTPVIIKYPFWRFTNGNPKATYVCINFGEAVCPPQIEKQAICINGDIGEVLK
ncbi:MAG: Sir2 silent information regulator family NAD-dependent deacetylase, partial [Clostridia bacterium]|nr:Sir2 silent information regulator family NAD-dependent deacetylase [Clostridia bacterium]